MISSLSLAGPIVATILVNRWATASDRDLDFSLAKSGCSHHARKNRLLCV